MKRSICVTILSVLLVVLLLAATLGAAQPPKENGLPAEPAAAETQAAKIASREEVIYGRLSADGTPESLYAVTILNVEEGGEVSESGEYSAVKNLTDTSEITLDGGSVSFTAQQGRFYYQGDMLSAALPWKVSVSYALDGTPKTAAELAGGAGELSLNIKTERDESVEGGYFENCMLQISVTLSTERCKNISAPEATAANSGLDKLLTYTVMPGEDGDFTLTADVEDFTMSGISFSALPYSLGIDLDTVPELNEGLSEMTGAVAQLSDGAVQLSSGAGALSGGARQLADGAWQLSSGLSAASAGSAGLNASSESILQALRGLAAAAEGTPLAEQLGALAQSYEQFDSGLAGYTSGVDALAGVAAQVSSGAAGLRDGAEKLEGGAGELSGGMAALNEQTASLPERIEALIAEYDSSDYRPVSFVSPRNGETVAIQFVFKTEDIILPEKEPEIEQNEVAETVWTRLLALFN